MTSSKRRGTLYVEVRLNGSCSIRTETIRNDVEKWLVSHHREIKVGATVQLVSPPETAQAIECIGITGHSMTRNFPDHTLYLLSESHLDIALYSLYSDTEHDVFSGEDEDESEKYTPRRFTDIPLPHRMFDGLWESLVFQDPIGELILRTIVRATKERSYDHHVNWSVRSWQNTVLLYGPPGSGKTTLAQALAQRLAIRLSNVYSNSRLLEIKSRALLSRYFGESSKEVGRLFESISRMAENDEQLVIVLIDEVESIAGCRAKASRASEVGDAIRLESTNEVLRGLDKLREHVNVVFFCTTNLLADVDSAFIDRCYIETPVDVPAADCIFEILRADLNSLIQCGKLDCKKLVYGRTPTFRITDGNDSPSTPLSILPSDVLSETPTYIPDLIWASRHLPKGASTAVSKLHKIATLAKGLSGRKLKALITQTIYMHIVEEPCDLQEFLDVLESVVEVKIGLSLCGLNRSSTAAVEQKTDADEHDDDTMAFLSKLEADNFMDVSNE